MKNIAVINSCCRLFDPMVVDINNASFRLKRNVAQFISLPEGKHELTVRQNWLITRSVITVEDNDMEISIHRIFPEQYYALGFGVILMLYALYFLSIISMLFPSAFTVLFVSSHMYTLLFKSRKCFKTTVCQRNKYAMPC